MSNEFPTHLLVSTGYIRHRDYDDFNDIVTVVFSAEGTRSLKHFLNHKEYDAPSVRNFYLVPPDQEWFNDNGPHSYFNGVHNDDSLRRRGYFAELPRYDLSKAARPELQRYRRELRKKDMDDFDGSLIMDDARYEDRPTARDATLERSLFKHLIDEKHMIPQRAPFGLNDDTVRRIKMYNAEKNSWFGRYPLADDLGSNDGLDVARELRKYEFHLLRCTLFTTKPFSNVKSVKASAMKKMKHSPSFALWRNHVKFMPGNTGFKEAFAEFASLADTTKSPPKSSAKSPTRKKTGCPAKARADCTSPCKWAGPGPKGRSFCRKERNAPRGSSPKRRTGCAGKRRDACASPCKWAGPGPKGRSYCRIAKNKA